MVGTTRRDFMRRTGEGVLALSAIGALAAPGAKATTSSENGDLRAYAAFATGLGIPLVTTDPGGWAAALARNSSGAVADRVGVLASDAASGSRASSLAGSDPYAAAQRVNAYLRARPAVQHEMAAAFSAVVDPNGFIDTAALAAGGFPESSSQKVPRLAPFPLG